MSETPNEIKGRHVRLIIRRNSDETRLQMKMRGIRTAIEVMRKWSDDADSQFTEHTS